MKPEAQRVAIHRARGLCPHIETKSYTCQGDSGFTCLECGEDLYGNRMPDYLNDLNAIQSAVLAQSEDFRIEFDSAMGLLASQTARLFCELTADDWSNCFLTVKRGERKLNA